MADSAIGLFGLVSPTGGAGFPLMAASLSATLLPLSAEGVPSHCLAWPGGDLVDPEATLPGGPFGPSAFVFSLEALIDSLFCLSFARSVAMLPWS